MKCRRLTTWGACDCDEDCATNGDTASSAAIEIPAHTVRMTPPAAGRRGPRHGGDMLHPSANLRERLFVGAVCTHLVAQQRRKTGLLLHQTVCLAGVLPQVVELLFSVLRRGDELVQRRAVAIEDGKPIGQKVRLV